MKNRTGIIFGATSGIGAAVCRELARSGYDLVLAGRDAERLAATASDLQIRNSCRVESFEFEATDFESHAVLVENCWQAAPSPVDVALICFGSLPDQANVQKNFAEVLQHENVNYLALVSIAHLLADRFVEQGSGTIALTSSVAGDRGRSSNYIYGASKAAVTAFASGLRQRLHLGGVNVLTIKPGFVDTPMTQGLLNPKSILVAKPERVARDIVAAIRRRKAVVYTPWFWRYILGIICVVPEAIFKRLRL